MHPSLPPSTKEWGLVPRHFHCIAHMTRFNRATVDIEHTRVSDRYKSGLGLEFGGLLGQSQISNSPTQLLSRPLDLLLEGDHWDLN